MIQSFWSKPVIEAASSRTDGGWLEKKYHYMSLALSCLLLRKHYGHVALVTDNGGRELLAGLLDLPYTNVTVALDNLDHYPSEAWSLAKVYSYTLQQEPFIHVDGDVFLFEKLPPRIASADVIAQNSLHISAYKLDHVLNQVLTRFKRKPADLENGPGQGLYHCGIFGGASLDLIRMFAHDTMTLIADNADTISAMRYLDRDPTTNFGMGAMDWLNTILESYHLASLVCKYNQTVECLLQRSDIAKFEFTRFISQHEMPVSYVHPIYHYKKDGDVCTQLAYKLRQEFPHHYYKIISLFG